jgi:hypothetical protein
MPRYISKKGEQQGFESIAHMTQFLARVPEDQWKAFQDVAKDYLNEKELPPKPLQKHALRLITKHKARKFIHNVEWARFKKTKRGAGIPEAINTIAHAASNLLGIKKLKELIGWGPTRKKLTEEEMNVVRALQQSYKPVKDRKNKVGDMIRVPEYGSERIVVFKETDGDYLIAVHGTKGNFHDILQDVGIMGGRQTTTSEELEDLLDKFDELGFKYSISGHSLATEYVYNGLKEHGENVEDIYLFSPASSPFQSVSSLKEEANDPRLHFFLNEGDIVASALYQQMNAETVDDRLHIAPYMWSPLAAHGLTQWLPEETRQTKEEADAELRS